MAKRLSSRIRVSDTALYSISLCYAFASVFLLPSSLKTVASLAFAGIAFVLLLLQKPCKLLRTNLPIPLLGLILLVLIAVLATVVLSPYSKTDLLVSTAFLLLSIALFYPRLEIKGGKLIIERIIYATTTVMVAWEVATNVGNISASYFAGAYDKNYLGIILYLFFAWCWATGRKVGVFVCIASAAVIGSRNYILMVAFFIAITILQKRAHRRYLEKRSAVQEVRASQIFLVFVLLFVLIVGFSFWWSGSVVGGDTSAYGESVNDSSNAIRFNSNVYALEHFVNHPELIVYGYGDDIISAMDIIQPSEDFAVQDGVFYNGFRIVQPHNVIINMLLKEGALFAIAYFGVLSFIFSRYFTKGNFAYWAPFLFGCMFMHSLLANYYLLFYLVVLTRADTYSDVQRVGSRARPSLRLTRRGANEVALSSRCARSAQ